MELNTFSGFPSSNRTVLTKHCCELAGHACFDRQYIWFHRITGSIRYPHCTQRRAVGMCSPELFESSYPVLHEQTGATRARSRSELLVRRKELNKYIVSLVHRLNPLCLLRLHSLSHFSLRVVGSMRGALGFSTSRCPQSLRRLSYLGPRVENCPSWNTRGRIMLAAYPGRSTPGPAVLA